MYQNSVRDLVSLGRKSGIWSSEPFAKASPTYSHAAGMR